MKLALLACFLALPLHAQCNLLAMRFDSPLSYGEFGGWHMRRVEWHAFKAGTSVLVTEGIHRSTGWSRRKSAVVMPLVSIALHVLGNRLGKYAVNWRDWLFDAGVSALPLVLTSRDKPVAVTSYAAFYAASACDGSP